MNILWQDLSLGARMLLKRPGFTLTAALTLSLGGQPSASARAQADSWTKALAFLNDGLKEAGER